MRSEPTSMARRAFTITELLVVVAVLAIASTLVIPLMDDGESTALRAAAELLAADIEEVQARTLADPEQATCLVPHPEGKGWYVALEASPGVPITSIDGSPLTRVFGTGALASGASIQLDAPELPMDRLVFDDQGAPESQHGSIAFRFRASGEKQAMTVNLSAVTGRVSIAY